MTSTTIAPTPAGSSEVSKVFLACAVTGAIGILLFPGAGVELLLVAYLWAYFLYFLVVSPERTILVFILLNPAIELLPEGMRLIPGLNFETIIVPALGFAALWGGPPVHRHRGNPLIVPVTYFAIVTALSALHGFLSGNAQTPTGAGWVDVPAYLLFSQAKNRVFFPFLGPIAFYLIYRHRQFKTAILLIAGVAIFISCEAFWTAASNPGGENVRAGGFIFDEPNGFGGFLALLLVLLGPTAVSPGLRWTVRFWLISASVATGAALLLTLSRGAWLGALVGLVCVAVMRGARALVVLLLLAATSLLWMPDYVIERAGHTFQERQAGFAVEAQLEASAEVRVQQWTDLPSNWIQAPVFGHGFGTYRKVAGRPSGQRQLIYVAHSSLIDLAVEEGLAGLVAYVWILYVLWRSAWRIRRSEDPFTRAVAQAFSGAIVALVVLDTTLSRFLDPQVMVYMWIAGGALARLSSEPTEESSQTRIGAELPALR